MNGTLYILRDREPVPEPNNRVWAQWFEDYEANRKVARTYLGDGALVVHTSFLGIDHNFEEEGPPLLFETMVYDTVRNEWWAEQWRYSDYDSALVGHQKVVRMVQSRSDSPR